MDERFFRKLLIDQGRVPWRPIIDKPRSYGAAHRTVMPSVINDTEIYATIGLKSDIAPYRARFRKGALFFLAA